jgi:PKD repeat protein
VSLDADKTTVEESEQVNLIYEYSDTASDIDSLEIDWILDGVLLEWDNLTGFSPGKSGKEEVTIIVTDDDGATAEATVEITVINVRPEAVILANRTKAFVGETIEFDASSSIDTESDVGDLHWTWRIGTEVIKGLIIKHAFTEAGEHEVSLTVTDDDGATSIATVTVTIEETPSADDDIVDDDVDDDDDTDDDPSVLSSKIFVIGMIIAIIVIVIIILIAAFMIFGKDRSEEVEEEEDPEPPLEEESPEDQPLEETVPPEVSDEAVLEDEIPQNTPEDVLDEEELKTPEDLEDLDEYEGPYSPSNRQTSGFDDLEDLLDEEPEVEEEPTEDITSDDIDWE